MAAAGALAAPAIASYVGAAASAYGAYKATRPKSGMVGGGGLPSGGGTSSTDKLMTALGQASSIADIQNKFKSQPTTTGPVIQTQAPQPMSVPPPMQPAQSQQNPWVIGDALRYGGRGLM
jgi:hypothetical protein